MPLTEWDHSSRAYAPGWRIGSEDIDGRHQRHAGGWPYSVYREATAAGATDICIASGIQDKTDALTIARLLNRRIYAALAVPAGAWSEHPAAQERQAFYDALPADVRPDIPA